MADEGAVEPGPPKILTGSTFAPGATPATPAPLSVAAAIVPATCVPWKLLWVSMVLSSLTKSQPRQSSTRPLPSSSIPFVSRPPPLSPGLLQNWPTSSGCVSSTPVSTTATVAPAPRVIAQASGASMSASAVPGVPKIVCPVLCRPHWLDRYGSPVAGKTVASG